MTQARLAVYSPPSDTLLPYLGVVMDDAVQAMAFNTERKRSGLYMTLPPSWQRSQTKRSPTWTFPMPKGPKGQKRPADVIGNAMA